MFFHHETAHLIAGLPKADLPNALEGWTKHPGGYSLATNPGVICGLRVSRKLGSLEDGAQGR